MTAGFETDDGVVYYETDSSTDGDEQSGRETDRTDEPTVCGFELEDGSVAYYEV